MIYPSIQSAIVSALTADAFDNTSKQAWQKLYNSADEDEGGDLAMLIRSRGAEIIDRTQVDCWVSARLHSILNSKHWNSLVAKYSAHKAGKVQAISTLQSYIVTPAPKLFLYKAITAWAIPQLKGVRPETVGSVTIDIPLDAPAWRRDSLVKAAISAGLTNAKTNASRSADMIILKESCYDMNTWDDEGRPESTRRRWRSDIYAKLDEVVREAIDHAQQILEVEGLLK